VADIVDPSHLLHVLRDFSPLRRVLLATAGTLQGTLSAYFGAPVTVEVVSQTADGDVMQRTVDLVCAARDLAVCRAATEIHVADAGIREMIVERRIGLGQIAALVGVPTSFELDEAAQEERTFWRTYRLWGDEFEFRITETFPCQLYPDVPEPS
jgi:hypothetical protein